MPAEADAAFTFLTLVVVAAAKLLLAATIPGDSPAARWIARMTWVMGGAYALAAFWMLDPAHGFRPWLPTLLRLAIVWTTAAAVRAVVRERGGRRAVGRDLAIRARRRWRTIRKAVFG